MKDDRDIDAAAAALADGKLVVFPTETVYGLGADALREEAVAGIFAAKGRPADNPLIVHLAEMEQLESVVAEVPEIAATLFKRFTPGPLTLVLPAAPTVPACVTAGLATVAVRFPRHPVARALLSRAGVPVAAPSANRSGEPSPTTVEMSRRSLGDAVSVYLDGGPCEVGLESTVAAVDSGMVRVLRPGAVTVEQLSRALGDEVPVRAPGAHDDGGLAARSPGTRHKHYRPKVPVFTADPARAEVAQCAVAYALSSGVRVGVICSQHGELSGVLLTLDGSEQSPVMRDYKSLDHYAQMLYCWFDELDSAVDVIVAEIPGAAGVGRAIRDRLGRAASGDAGLLTTIDLSRLKDPPSAV